MFSHHTSLGSGGRKLRHDLVHSILNRSGILFRTRANDSLANAAENELVGSAIDEIQDQRTLGVLIHVNGHSYSVPVSVRAVAGREIGKVTTGNYVEFFSGPDSWDDKEISLAI